MVRDYDSRVQAHYREQAARHGLAPSSTMEDLRVREMETRIILQFLEVACIPDVHRVICDVGCGNGYTLSQIRAAFPQQPLLGCEYSPELRALAASRFEGDPCVSIRTSDIRQPLGEEPEIDVLLCQRVLINLMDAEDQTRALRNIVSAVRPQGYLLFIEAFESPLGRLNEARAEFGLGPISQAIHNQYLKNDFFALAPELTPIEHTALPPNFLSSHYFISRVFHAVALGENPFKRNSHFVQFFSEAFSSPIGDYSPVRALAFRKTA